MMWRCVQIALALSCLAAGATAGQPTSAAPSQPARPAALQAAGPTTRPDYAVASADCVSARCHAGLKSYKYVHGPIAANACEVCHELKDARTHTFTLIRPGAAMCTYCHDFSTAGKPVVHKPVALGECTACHDPHGGATPALMRDASMAQTCHRCHDDVNRGHTFQHTPAAKGACDTCHAPHASNFPNLLDVVGVDLCLTCHRDFEARMTTAKYLHKAFDKGCEACHDPHGSTQPMSLRQPITPLCLSCHKKIAGQIASALDKHAVVTSDKSCLTCHTPHGGNLPNLMVNLPVQTCLRCHDKPVTTPDGRTIPAVPQVAQAKGFKHGPLREGQCGGCHEVHGGQRDLLLDRTYTGGLYVDQGNDDYALCLKCHDARLISDPRAPTNFRNGDLNLHLVHVKAGPRGHNCRVCHATHVADNSRLVRSTLQFGKWRMPIGLTLTPTGGSCKTGCHPTFAYDRVHPKVYWPATTQPATLVRGAGPQTPFKSWTGKDISGQAVTIPDPARPTVVMVVGSQVAEVQDVVSSVRQALGNLPPVRLALVFAGPQARAHAQAFATGAKEPALPVIADAEGGLCEKLDVHGWPTTVVLKPDGSKVAVVSGTSAALALRLRPYLDYVTGKVNRQGLDSDLHPVPGVVADQPDHQARWSLELAQKLLDQGQAPRARALLLDALKTGGVRGDLQAALAQALMRLGQPKEALALVDQIAAGQVTPARRNLLKAQALALLGQWDQAKTLALSVVGEDKNSAQAHYLLGQIYAHEGNWPNAAAEYRLSHDLAHGE